MVTSTNYTSLAYVQETVPGETPENPVFNILPVTSNALQANITTAVSATIRDDRQTEDLVVVDFDVTGDVGYEMSYIPWKPMIIAALQSDSPIHDVDDGINDVTIDSGTRTFTTSTGDFTTLGFVPGVPVRAWSFADEGATLKRFVTPQTVTPTVLTVAEDDLPDYGPDRINFYGESWANGADPAQNFTFRRYIKVPQDPVIETFFYDRGCQIGAFSWDFNVGSILTGTISIVGRTEEDRDTGLPGETINPLPEVTIMNAVSSLTKFKVRGLPANTEVNSIGLVYDNAINQAKAIGTLGAVALASFKLQLNGSIEIYFQDRSLYTLFLQSQEFSIEMELEDTNGNVIHVLVPRAKFEELSAPVPGEDQFLFSSGSWRALRDPITNKMFIVTFVEAPEE